MKLKKILDFFNKEQKFTSSYNDKDGVVTISCNKKHDFKKGKEYVIEIDNKIIPFKVKEIIDKRTITSKYFTPAIYVWTSEILQEENIYKVGITNWQSVFDRVKQTDTTGVVHKPRIVDWWYIDVTSPKESLEIEKIIHNRLNLIRTNREFVKNDYKTEIKPTILNVINEYNAKKINTDGPNKFPRYYQYIRKELAREYYKTNDIGYIQSACGTGKSYDGFWIYDELINSKVLNPKSGIIVLFVPSLGLLDQTVDDLLDLFTTYSYNLRTIKIGSDKNSTTESSDLISFIKESDNRSVNLIACTYHSHKIIQNSLAITNTKVDFTIYDEVHRTAGFLDKHFLQAIKNSVIPSQKKLSMTATVVKYTDSSVGVAGMSNKQLYGECFHTYSTSSGIEDGYLTPIKIVVLVVDEKSIDGVKEIINENKKLSTVDLFNDDEFGYSSFVIQLIAGLEAFKQGLWTHPIYYANTISRAERFNECMEYLAPKFGVNLDYIKLLSGKDSAELRNNELKYKFSKAKKGLVSNSQCLTEGISVNCVDGIGFIDPRESVVNQTQIYGRGMRLYPGKKETTVIIPVVYNNNKIESNYWNETLNVALNMISSSDEIQDILDNDRFDLVVDSNIKNGIEERTVKSNQISKNNSGGNKKPLSENKKTEPFYIPINGLLSLKFKEIVKGHRKSPRETFDKISTQQRMYDYFGEYENGISVSLREFNKKGVKKYSKYIKTKEWHIENYSKLNDVSEEKANEELINFFKRIEKSQEELFNLIYETTI